MQALPAATQEMIVAEAPGFSGLSVQGVGYAMVDGSWDDVEEVDRAGVHIYVSRGSQRFLKALPDSVGSVTCRVHNIGRLYVKPHQASATTNRGNLYERNGRIACGSSCAPSGRDYSGTIGAIAKKDNHLFALSNNHVFADCNHTPIGQPILSPSAMDGRPGVRAPGEVCRHSEIIELRSGAPTLVTPCREDLAIGELSDPNSMSSWQGDNSAGYDTPTASIAPTTGMVVKKFGRTTGLTFGTVQSLQYRTHIPYDSEYFRALVWFQGVWSIRSNDSDAFALGGDSGSLVVTEDGKHAVGVLFAATAKGSHGFIVPMDRVSHAFGGISLVGKHNI